MVMDPGIRELSGLINGFCLGDPLCNQVGGVAALEAEDPESFFNLNELIDPPPFLPEVANGVLSPPASAGPEGHFPEEPEIFSDIALSYIKEMLMEEEMDDRAFMYQGSPALRDAVKPFYEVLGEEFPPPRDLLSLFSDSSESPEDSSSGHCGNSISSGSPSGVVDGGSLFEFGEHPSPQVSSFSVDYSSRTSFGSSSNSSYSVVDGVEEHQVRTGEEDLQIEIQQLWQYKKGVEEAIKFLPDQQKLVIDLEASSSPFPGEDDAKPQPQATTVFAGVKKEKEEKEQPLNGSRNRKKPHQEDLDLEEGRSTKHSAVCSDEEEVSPEMFDKVLLCPPGGPNEAISSLREALQSELESKASKNGQSKGHSGKSRGRRQAKKEVVDLRTLLIHCAQAVATDDRRSAGELLKQIRQHSSMDGDGSQRLAHYFADGLEARLAGTGVELYHSLAAKTRAASAAAILKAYHLYLAACPFKKVSHFVANQTILNVAEGAARLHIVDFGIFLGFQWPCLIQRLSLRPGGPPRLRITGIEVPQPGFRPAERVEETGRRLADYARRFGVPFEYRPIAAKWEDVHPEDLGIEGDEVLVVNCLYRFRNLVDETVVVDSPRDRVLHSVRRMRPDVFIHGVVNGAYGAPFFVTRFREALFHFSALFDMLETTVPREHAERRLIEREIFGREAMNVIACEGAERVERPETYKQWQARNLRAGLAQMPLNQSITRKTKDKVRNCYNKDFIIDEDSGWLLQGWKGRIIYALSTWRPSGGGF